jgi:hypothetical protein
MGELMIAEKIIIIKKRVKVIDLASSADCVITLLALLHQQHDQTALRFKISRSSHLTPFVQSSFTLQRNLSGSDFMDNKGLSLALVSTPIWVSQIVTQPLVSPVVGKI